MQWFCSSAFIVVCFLLWQALRHFPSFSEFSNKHLTHRWETVVPSAIVPPILVTVFYEALCPDSRSFFTKQLLPTFEKIPLLIQINLVPYGKAMTETVGTSYRFTCQHGPLECRANKIHACAIAKVTQPDIQLKYITCMISDNMNPEKIGEECAQDHDVRWKEVVGCAVGSEGEELLKQHGEATNALNPRVSFVPTVLLDQSQDNQPGILKNLFKEVCTHLQEQRLQLVPECG
ncbi:GILT-like protein 1 isoform X2 [Zootermopsis nevadensis]|uniref:GILT-like protein 1 isoform X2 n=1 Tax=Zootermopsis nevadensis TaxID=136037 RepID=UPI000B8E899B|nr:GILT-like protein 1 isoform X2 [Zootermopsis nevadensis]